MVDPSDIVRQLADAPAPAVPGGTCTLCGVWVPLESDPDDHDDSCPWAQARRWVDAQPAQSTGPECEACDDSGYELRAIAFAQNPPPVPPGWTVVRCCHECAIALSDYEAWMLACESLAPTRAGFFIDPASPNGSAWHAVELAGAEAPAPVPAARVTALMAELQAAVDAAKVAREPVTS